MSEIKAVSPLLDGISVGNPISDHHGVRCCPAIRENTDKKYILKIISIPASQVQMDALLYAGAYKDPADAMEYFRQTGEKIMEEAQLLKKLSRLDGFLSFENWHMQPIIRRRLGYEVYLLGSYKRSLERYMKKHSATHLEALNLGMDMCAALAVSRSAGALYVALKPSNIFVSEKKEYRIGDLGFIPLDALSYTALPEKYQSRYTPPELFDPMASINLTADTYALGMILYQLYNDGQLPFKGKHAPETVLPSPVNADYEMAEIIMKAIHPDPAQRWNDPKDMGKALASYMQRNSVNDIPITPHTPLDLKPEDISVLSSGKSGKKAPAKPIMKEMISEPAAVQDAVDKPQPAVESEPVSASEPLQDTAPAAEPESAVEIESLPEPEPVVVPEAAAAPEFTEEPEAVTEPELPEASAAIWEAAPAQMFAPASEPERTAEPEAAEEPELPMEKEYIAEAEPVREAELPAEPEAAATPETVAKPEPVTEPEALAEPEFITETDTAAEFAPASVVPEAPEAPLPLPEPDAIGDPVEVPEEVPAVAETVEVPAQDAFSEELTRIISKADSLITHQIPDTVFVPNIPEISDPFAFAKEDSDELDNFDVPEEPLLDTDEEVPPPEKKERKRKNKKRFADPKYQRRRKRFLLILLALLMLAAAGFGVFWYYQNLYLQTIDDILLTAETDRITVAVKSDIDPAKLTVRCIDAYGKANTRGISEGSTVFTGLQPNSAYTIELDVSGFHKLTGKTSETCTTEATTKILSFTSAVGSEDGSVLLSFTVDGDEPSSWTVYYGTDGEDELRKTFSGHSVSISGLTVGKSYTFRLDPGENISLGGENTLVLTASKMVQAEDVLITSENGTDISVSWKTPGDLVVDSWDVVCYNSSGYRQQITTAEQSVSFTELDPAMGYTLEITASGMTQSARTNISANPLNVTTLQVDDSSSGKLNVNWEFTGEAPKDGWLMVYNLIGGEKRIIKCTKPSAEIPSKVPGATYQIALHSPDGTTVFNSVHSYTVPEGEPFEKYNLSANKLAVNMLKTPDEQNWRVENIPDSEFTNTFAVGDSISLAMRSSDTVYLLGSKTEVLFVIQDPYGNIVPDLVSLETPYWNTIWNSGNAKNGELTIPKVPTTPGNYVLTLYFDGMKAAQLNFTIVQ